MNNPNTKLSAPPDRIIRHRSSILQRIPGHRAPGSREELAELLREHYRLVALRMGLCASWVTDEK